MDLEIWRFEDLKMGAMCLMCQCANGFGDLAI